MDIIDIYQRPNFFILKFGLTITVGTIGNHQETVSWDPHSFSSKKTGARPTPALRFRVCQHVCQAGCESCGH